MALSSRVGIWAVLLLSFFARGAAAAPPDEPVLDVVPARAFPKLQFNRAVVLTHAGDGTNRLFVGTQLGTIHVFPNQPNVADSELFLDIKAKTIYKDAENEEGLLGLAFHPRFKENGQFFVYYTAADSPHTSVVARYRVSADNPRRADPDSGEELLRLPSKPYWNHNGGTLVFGPDGYLYIAVGDGGLANDPFKSGQDLGTLLGKILRIDVDRREGDKPYAVPADNPFVFRQGARGEVWAYGLRNVWRMSFDRDTGTFWAADVGQDLWEEINIITRGGNYGWSLREAGHKFGPNGAEPRDDLIDPVWEYHHDIGKSVTGGHVYRGRRLPRLSGKYLYADYVSGQLWALEYDEKGGQATANYKINGNIMPVMSFGEDAAGEVYYLTTEGKIYTFVEAKK